MIYRRVKIISEKESALYGYIRPFEQSIFRFGADDSSVFVWHGAFFEAGTLYEAENADLGFKKEWRRHISGKGYVHSFGRYARSREHIGCRIGNSDRWRGRGILDVDKLAVRDVHKICRDGFGTRT